MPSESAPGLKLSVMVRIPTLVAYKFVAGLWVGPGGVVVGGGVLVCPPGVVWFCGAAGEGAGREVLGVRAGFVDGFCAVALVSAASDGGATVSPR
jgi:hypothetical protein